MVLSFRVNTLSLGAAQGLYWAFAVLMGLSLSTIFLVYTGTSIAQTFFSSAAAFSGLSLFVYPPTRTLSSFAPFLLLFFFRLLLPFFFFLFFLSLPFPFSFLPFF